MIINQLELDDDDYDDHDCYSNVWHFVKTFDFEHEQVLHSGVVIETFNVCFHFAKSTQFFVPFTFEF